MARETPGAGGSDAALPRVEAHDPGHLLEIIEDLNAVADAETLLDRMASWAGRLAGYRRALLSLALPQGATVGTYNLSEDERARFRSRAERTDIEYRVAKRRRIRRYAFPGTGICYVPHDAPLPRSTDTLEFHAGGSPPGTWHPDDRLFLMVTGAAGREIGILSLDAPLDGRAPREDNLLPLRIAERVLAIGGSLLQTRILEEGLRRSEEELRAVVDDAPVGIYRRSPDRRLVSVNRRMAAIFGYPSPEAMIADPSAPGRCEHEDVAAAVDALAHGGEFATFDAEGTRRDGEPIRLRLTARRMPGREFVLGIVEDVTEASLLAEHLQQVRRIEAVGTLASGIAHDFNNVLTGILGYASLVRERLPEGSELLAPTRAIEEAAQRGSDLTRRLLGIARRDDGPTVPVDAAAVLQDCARTARETFDRRIEVSSHAEPGLPLVRARASELHQALLNLCINARDAMPEGGRLHLSAAADARGPMARPDGAPAGPWVRIEVRDTGLGMDEATRARIFEPFFTTKPKGKGTGLGLFMVYSSLRSLGGAVEVDSAPGQGTVFRAFLPVASNAEAPGAVPAAEPEGPARAARVLLVEDEEMLRSLATVVLRGQGHTVETATDGAEAVARLEAAGPPPDVVILDLVLPRISGADVFRRLRARHPGLPVLLTSGQMEGDSLDEDVRAGVAAVLPKPYRPAELVAAVRRALAAGRP